jgi:cobalt-zinc-cadmium efflux system outer membrane protein
MNKTIRTRFSIALMRAAFRFGGMGGLILFVSLSAQSPAAAVITTEIPVTLTEKQAIELFFQRNLDLLAARYNIEYAEAQQMVAAAMPNPTFTFEMLELSKNPNQNVTGSYGCPGPGGGGGALYPNPSPGQIQYPGNINCGPAYYFTFIQLIEMAGKRGLRMKSTAIAAQAAASDFRDAVRILTNMVRDAYYGLLQAQKNRWLMQETVNYYRDIVDSNRLRHRAGDLAESDLLRIETEEMGAQSDLDNAEVAVEQAQAALAVTLNWPDKSMQFVAADQWPAIRDIGQNLKRDALINKAVALRPDLLGDKQRTDQADKGLELARRLKFPDLTVNAGYAHDAGNPILDTGFVGISLPLPVFYQYQGEESQAAVNLQQMRLAAEETELGVRSDVVNALAAWESAEKVARRYESELIDHAGKVREREALAYRNGAATVLDFIDAQRTYKAVMLDYFTAMINRINAYYDLAASLGVEPDVELRANRYTPI